MDRQQVQMPSNVVSSLDTLSAFKSMWPGLKSHTLQSLVEVKLARGPDVDAHNAASDTKTLQELVAFTLEEHLDDGFLNFLACV